MATPSTIPWTIKSTALFRIFMPEIQPTLLSGYLLLEVDGTGKAARSYRFHLAGTATIHNDLPAGQLLPLPEAADCVIHYHLTPDFIRLRDSRFSGEWLDLIEEIHRGRITITRDGVDYASEILRAAQTAATADPAFGAAIRWCIDGGDGEDLHLLLHLHQGLLPCNEIGRAHV